MSASLSAAKRSRTIAKDGRVATARHNFFLAATIAAAFGLSILLAPASVSAQSQVFTVTGVPVDARGGTTTDARTKGLQEGQIKALERLLRRLVPNAYQAALPDLSTRDAIDLVRDFSVSNERTASGRYLADLIVRFRPESIRSTLRLASVPFAETVSKPVAVVPVYQESVVSEPVIWSDSNPWMDAWIRLPQAMGLVPRQLPFGDLEDLSTLRIEDAQARDQVRLQTWAGRYGADDVVVATASLLGSLGSESVSVTLYSTRTGAERRLDVPAAGGQTWSELFIAAAEQAWAVVEDEWKKENMLQFDSSGQITALVPLNSLEDWLTVRSRLEQVPLIDRHELQAIARDRAQVTIYYLGDEDQLKLAMAQSDLGFVWQGEAWVIEDRAAETNVVQTFGGNSTAHSMPVPGSQSSIFSQPLEQVPPPAYPSSLFTNGTFQRGP
jgi:hypothetical protein